MKGTIIKESLADENIIDFVTIEGAEIWKAENHTESQPLYWTAIFFSTDEDGFINGLSRAIKEGWYVDLSDGTEKVLVFQNKIIRYPLGDAAGKQLAADYCRTIGVPESQIDWND